MWWSRVWVRTYIRTLLVDCGRSGTMDARQKDEQLRGSGGDRRPRAPASGRAAPAAANEVHGASPSLTKDADAQQQKRKKQRPPRSLLLLLKSFVGLRVRIDLKNDSVIEGVVEEVVHDMEYVLMDTRLFSWPKLSVFALITARVLCVAWYSFTMIDACETKPNVRGSLLYVGAPSNASWLMLCMRVAIQ